MNIREEIGSRLRALREEQGLTIRELAEKADVGFAHINKIENGTYNLRVDTLHKVATALGAAIEITKKTKGMKRNKNIVMAAVCSHFCDMVSGCDYRDYETLFEALRKVECLGEEIEPEDIQGYGNPHLDCIAEAWEQYT